MSQQQAYLGEHEQIGRAGRRELEASDGALDLRALPRKNRGCSLERWGPEASGIPRLFAAYLLAGDLCELLGASNVPDGDEAVLRRDRKLVRGRVPGGGEPGVVGCCSRRGNEHWRIVYEEWRILLLPVKVATRWYPPAEMSKTYTSLESPTVTILRPSGLTDADKWTGRLRVVHLHIIQISALTVVDGGGEGNVPHTLHAREVVDFDRLVVVTDQQSRFAEMPADAEGVVDGAAHRGLRVPGAVEVADGQLRPLAAARQESGADSQRGGRKIEGFEQSRGLDAGKRRNK